MKVFLSFRRCRETLRTKVRSRIWSEKGPVALSKCLADRRVLGWLRSRAVSAAGERDLVASRSPSLLQQLSPKCEPYLENFCPFSLSQSVSPLHSLFPSRQRVKSLQPRDWCSQSQVERTRRKRKVWELRVNGKNDLFFPAFSSFLKKSVSLRAHS